MGVKDRFLDRVGRVFEEVRSNSGKAVAAYARQQRDALIQGGRSSPVFTTFVDGVEDGIEENVKLNDGFISYLFASMNEAVVFALAVARDKSPVKSGAYRESWFLVVDGQPYVGQIQDIPKGSVIAVTNKQRYHRKIDTGGQITSVPPGITEAVRQAVMKRYPRLQVDRAFITIPGDEPLKGRGVESGISFQRTRRGGKWVRKRPPRPARAKDRRAGQPLTYPAVIISERVR